MIWWKGFRWSGRASANASKRAPLQLLALGVLIGCYGDESIDHPRHVAARHG